MCRWVIKSGTIFYEIYLHYQNVSDFNPLIKFCAIQLAILSHKVADPEGGYQAINPVNVDICLTIFQWQENMTKLAQ